MVGDEDGQNENLDVVVVGAGPAGRWLAVHLIERAALCGVELEVAIVDPAPEDAWPNTYGLWSDELQELEVEVDCRRSWSQVAVKLGRSEQVLKRAYSRIDNEGFRRRLDESLDAGGVHWIQGMVDSVEHQSRWSTVRVAGGDSAGERLLRARVVVDASGGAAGLLEAAAGGDVGYQTAYGLEAEFDGDPLDGREMVLMDFEAFEEDEKGEAPTFLYGMHLGKDRYFVEETVLVAKDPVDIDKLRDKLYRRLDRMDVSVGEVYEEERCKIPMGTALPSINQRVVGFGAAAGFVHPATGYQMARMLRAGAPLAEVIVDGLSDEVDLAEISQRAWDVLWPVSMRRARQLLIFGRDRLIDFDREQTGRFFEAFFELPDEDWQAYMSGEADHREVSRCMWRLFTNADNHLRWMLARSAIGDGRRVGRALFSRESGGVYG